MSPTYKDFLSLSSLCKNKLRFKSLYLFSNLVHSCVKQEVKRVMLWYNLDVKSKVKQVLCELVKISCICVRAATNSRGWSGSMNYPHPFSTAAVLWMTSVSADRGQTGLCCNWDTECQWDHLCKWNINTGLKLCWLNTGFRWQWLSNMDTCSSVLKPQKHFFFLKCPSLQHFK